MPVRTRNKRPLLLMLLALFTALIAYLLFWPVGMSPQAWNAKMSTGYIPPFAVNTDLQNLEYLPLGDHHGPEDIAARREDGQLFLYASSQNGDILKIDPRERTVKRIANTGGVPLGLAFDGGGNLIIADAHLGLLSMNIMGDITVLTTSADGVNIAYADELDIASDGKIYFSDASSKFAAKDYPTTLAASMMELMEHGNTGRVLVYDPADQSTKTVLSNLSFANGVALCPQEDCLLIVETGTYSIKKHWLSGKTAGMTETIIDNLPGFPDNLDRGQDGRYWFGLTSPRADALDKLSQKPFVRKIVQRLPAFMRPSAQEYGFIAAINHNGNVMAQYQDPEGGYAHTTGAIEAEDGYLYITSLTAKNLARKKLY